MIAVRSVLDSAETHARLTLTGCLFNKENLWHFG